VAAASSNLTAPAPRKQRSRVAALCTKHSRVVGIVAAAAAAAAAAAEHRRGRCLDYSPLPSKLHWEQLAAAFVVVQKQRFLH